MYVQSGILSHFHWKFIAVLTQNPFAFMLVYINNASHPHPTPPPQQQYEETWIFVMFSEQWPPGNIYQGFILFMWYQVLLPTIRGPGPSAWELFWEGHKHILQGLYEKFSQVHVFKGPGAISI